MKSKMAMAHKFLTGFVALTVFVQMFLAGIWHAGVVNNPEAHVYLGLGMLLASLLALIAAAVARMPRRTIGITAVVFVLMLLQPILIEQRRIGIPFLSAFHTLNAAFIGVTSSMAMQASRTAREEESAVDTLQPTAGD